MQRLLTVVSMRFHTAPSLYLLHPPQIPSLYLLHSFNPQIPSPLTPSSLVSLSDASALHHCNKMVDWVIILTRWWNG